MSSTAQIPDTDIQGTALGVIWYGGTAGAGTELAGNTTTTRKFLRMTGTGSAAAAPAWDTVTAGDLPAVVSFTRVGISEAADADLPLVISSANMTSAAGTPTVQITDQADKNGVQLQSAALTSASNGPTFEGIASGGTLASPTRTTINTPLLIIGAGGYDNAGTPVLHRKTGYLKFGAVLNWTTSNWATYLNFYLTSGTTTSLLASFTASGATFYQEISGQIAAGTNSSTDGLLLQNTTAATAGNQAWSPRLRLTGNGWRTNSTAQSEPVDWIMENRPVQGAADPSSILALAWQINSGGFTDALQLLSGGQVSVISSTDSTSVSTGSLITAGGVGIAKNLTLGGIIQGFQNATIPAQPLGGYAHHFVSADGTQNAVLGDASASTGWNMVGRVCNGTMASPSNTAANTLFFQAAGRGYANGAYTGTAITLQLLALNNWSSTDNSTYAAISLVPSGSTTLTSNVFLLTTALLTLKSALSVGDATDASSSSTGSIVTAGGVGIAKSLVVGTTITSGDPNNGSGAWLLGKIRSGVALVVSATAGLQVNIDGVLYTVALLSTNP